MACRHESVLMKCPCGLQFRLSHYSLDGSMQLDLASCQLFATGLPNHHHICTLVSQASSLPCAKTTGSTCIMIFFSCSFLVIQQYGDRDVGASKEGEASCNSHHAFPAGAWGSVAAGIMSALKCHQVPMLHIPSRWQGVDASMGRA